MQRVVSFYEKLPRGRAPDVQPKGLIGRYQARYFGKNPSAMRTLTPGILSTYKTRRHRLTWWSQRWCTFWAACCSLGMRRSTTSTCVSESRKLRW